MRCLAVCQSELVIRMLDEILMPGFDVEFVVESRALARRLHDSGTTVRCADPKRTDAYLKADLTPGTAVIIEDSSRRSIRRIVSAVRDAGGTLIYVLGMGVTAAREREDALKGEFPELNYLTMTELFGTTLQTELARSLTRLKVQQYQRYFADADRVLILLHNDPDPDALASGLALRTVLRRTRQTAIIGAVKGVTRPENLRMQALLDIHVEPIDAAALASFERVAMVDVQPHYFEGLTDRADLVIDHHPEQTGYLAVFHDIRANYGSTSTILTEHLRAVDANISERTATALLYAIKSDTAFFNRGANRADVDAFSYLYPLAHPTLIRKMEGADITMERLDYVVKAKQNGHLSEEVYCAYLGRAPREDFVPYVADFYLQMESVRWTVVAAVVADAMVICVRNLGFSRHAGDFVRKYFGEIGNAGGHRSMAKAVVPLAAFRQKFGSLQADEITDRLHDLMHHYLHQQQPDRDRRLTRA
ncbi:MAG: hypothetical protein FJW23_05815 [Acidimicrobiia bacterium]|nr:hypothetical protein [Acidimicrobiia bacterium]